MYCTRISTISISRSVTFLKYIRCRGEVQFLIRCFAKCFVTHLSQYFLLCIYWEWKVTLAHTSHISSSWFDEVCVIIVWCYHLPAFLSLLKSPSNIILKLKQVGHHNTFYWDCIWLAYIWNWSSFAISITCPELNVFVFGCLSIISLPVEMAGNCGSVMSLIDTPTPTLRTEVINPLDNGKSHIGIEGVGLYTWQRGLTSHQKIQWSSMIRGWSTFASIAFIPDLDLHIDECSQDFPAGHSESGRNLPRNFMDLLTHFPLSWRVSYVDTV